MPRRAETANLDELRSRETFDRQLAHTGALIAYHREMIARTSDDGDRDDLEDWLEVLEFAERRQREAAAGGLTDAELFSINTQIDRILDSVEYPLDEIEVDPLQMFRSIYLGAIFGHASPNLSPRERARPLGSRKAGEESAYLYDPARGAYFTSGELAALTPEEVARLDVSPDHPAWHRLDETLRLRPDRLADFEAEHLRGIRAELIRDGDLAPGQDYRFRSSQRVLILEEVYRSASSPKCVAEDAFGVEWKLKWADEVQVEPVAAALYLLAGARQTDFSFVTGDGIDEMVLVLDHPDETKRKEDKEDERHPPTYEAFNQAMIDFYGVDMGVFVRDRGRLTRENIDRILRHFPAGGGTKHRKEDLLGREWVTFKETLLELRPKGYIRRVDGARMSDVAAVHDRGARGSFLFNLWIANRDAKDNNNKTYFIKEGHPIVDYREGHHDLGLALGPLLRSGELNAVPTGTGFARKGLLGRNWRFPQGQIFKSEAWRAATWSDMKWMALRITSLAEPEIRAAAATTRWPDFVQEALVYKLMDRRNRIAELYGLTGSLDLATIPAPTMAISLADPAEIRAAEHRYGLPEDALRTELVARGWRPGHREILLEEGTITSCRDSALIAALVEHRHPSGLERRYSRGRKGDPPDCAPRFFGF